MMKVKRRNGGPDPITTGRELCIQASLVFALSMPVLARSVDAPLDFSEAFSKEIEHQIAESQLPLAYSQKVNAWGARLIGGAWRLVQIEEPSLFEKNNSKANSASYEPDKSSEEIARRALLLMDMKREKMFSTLGASEALEATRLTLLIARAASPFECAQIFRKKAPNEDNKGRPFIRLASELSMDDFDRYLRLRVTALDRFVDGIVEYETLKSSEASRITQSYRAKILSMVRKDIRILGHVLAGKKYSHLPDEDLCRYGLALLGSVVSGDEGVSSKRALLFVQGKLK